MNQIHGLDVDPVVGRPFRRRPRRNGGCTKPINQDEDITVHQVVTDVKRREIWLKRPNPDVFADWTHFDLKELWSRCCLL